MRVLVLDAQAKQALPVVRDLCAAGHQVFAGSPWPMAAAAAWSRRVRRIATDVSSATTFISQIAVIIGSYDIEVVLPLKDETTRIVAEHVDALGRAGTCLAPAATIRRAGHKAHVRELVAGTPLAAPRTIACADVRDITGCIPDATYPAVVKAARGSGVIRYANTVEELGLILEEWIPKYGEVVIQEYIRGAGVGCFALYDRGGCVSAYTHRRLREYPATGGISVSAESTHDPELKEAALALLDALEWHGPAMVECKREANTGRLVLIEVNTKFWGSLDLALACGLQMPRWAVAIAAGEQVSPHMDYPAGVRMHWPAPAGLAQALTSWAGMKGFARDISDRECRSDWRLADPLPHLVQVAQMAGVLWHTRGRWSAPHGVVQIGAR